MLKQVDKGRIESKDDKCKFAVGEVTIQAVKLTLSASQLPSFGLQLSKM
jgi:hypothetical protein